MKVLYIIRNLKNLNRREHPKIIVSNWFENPHPQNYIVAKYYEVLLIQFHETLSNSWKEKSDPEISVYNC